MALTERLALVVSLDADGAIKGLNNVGKAADRNLGRTENKLDRTAQKMQKVGLGMLAAAGLAATGLYKAGQSAADLEQAVGGTEAVFKDTAGTIDKFAKTAASKMGLSETAFRQATTSIGGQLKGLGFDVEDAADKAVELTGVASDLAATYGGTTAEAVQALGAAFRGEADPAERFNLRLNQNTVNAKAVALGLAETTSKVDANAKAQATLALITEQSADAQGQFARETGTAAGAMQIANAEFENAKASLGEAVAPIMAGIAEKASALAGGFSDLNKSTGGLVSELATFGTIGLAAGGGLLYVAGKAIELRGAIHGLSGAKGVFAGVAAGVAGLAAAWSMYQSVMEKATATGEAATASIREQFAGLDPAKTSMEDLQSIIDAMDGDIADLSASVEGSSAPWDADRRAALNAMIDSGVEFREELAQQQQAARDLAQEMNIAEDEALRLVLANEATAEAAGTAGEAFDAEAAAAAGLVTQLSEMNDALKAQFDPLFGAVDAMWDLKDAQQAAADAVKEHGENSSEAIQANQDLARSAMDFESALIDLETAVTDGSVSLEDAKTTMQRWVDQGLITQASADDTIFAFQGVKTAADDIPERIPTKVVADTAEAEAKLTWVAALLGALYGAGANVYVRPTRNPDRAFAEGGPVYMAGGGPMGTDTVPAWLTPGEFVMRKSAVDRIGMANLAAMNAGATASGSTFNVNVNGPVTRPLVDDMIYALRVEQVRVDA